MVLHNFVCSAGHISEKFIDVKQKDWKEQICGQDGCDFPASHQFVSRRLQILHGKPIVIYKNKDGEVRFPGSADEAMPQNYQDQGFVRCEMNFHEARKFQKEFNAHEQFKESDKLEFMHYMESESRKQERSDLLQQMQGFSERGRDFARYVIDQSNREDSQKYYSQNPGFYIEAIE